MARLDSAHEHLTTGLRIAREVGNLHYEGVGLLGLGMTCRDLGRLRESAEHFELAVSRNEQTGWKDDSLALHQLGWVYWELGRLTDGLDVLGPRETSYGRRRLSRNGRAMMLDVVAKINIELGHHEEAMRQAERALAMVKDSGRSWIQAGILNTVASAHRKLAQLGESAQADNQALDLAREARFRRHEVDSILGLSTTQKLLGRRDQARLYAEQALNLARDHHFRVAEGQAVTLLCEIAESEAAHDATLTLGREALVIHRQTGHRLGEARTLAALSRTLHACGDPAGDAMRQQARGTFADIGVPEATYHDLDW
ncbi:tetratricopeptide repeat protein [Streptomyces sp. NPDC001902]